MRVLNTNFGQTKHGVFTKRPEALTFADPAVQTELRTALTSALEELPDHYSAVIILHDVSGHVDWTPAEKLAAFSTVPAAV